MSKYHNLHRAKWQRLRTKVLKKYSYICSNHFGLHNGVIKPAEEVHHILTAEDYPDYFFLEKNLVPLCTDCHKEAHRLLKTNKPAYEKIFEDKVSDLLTIKINSKGCFKDKEKKRYYCECFKCFRPYPCSKCSDLLNA